MGFEIVHGLLQRCLVGVLDQSARVGVSQRPEDGDAFHGGEGEVVSGNCALLRTQLGSDELAQFLFRCR